MSVECPQEYFQEFKKHVDSFYVSTGEVQSYLQGLFFDSDIYDTIPPEIELSDLIPLDDDDFDDWDCFEYWFDMSINDVVPRVDHEHPSCTSLIPNWDQMREFESPREYFKDRDSVLEFFLRVSSEFRSGLDLSNDIVSVVEITSNGEELLIVFYDNDSWSLGHNNTVVVYKSLEDFEKTI